MYENSSAYDNFSITELFLSRKWLKEQTESLTLSSEYAKLFTEALKIVDKELRQRIIGNVISFEDGSFDKTLKDLFNDSISKNE